ncbi:MAG: FprA family A-type flavoprotein [Clostridiales bacterium]|jgi:flavorubredoxin|nr:FprA family A-type flavoprotein [Clostridiales bacterium]MDR2713106.1 FprA family A-type flavoprotein [Clostridiales bacterium]
MGIIKAKENIFYVGVLDKDLRVFDIVMYTEYGTTYNSYLVKGEGKTVLFETVKEKFYDQFAANIKEVCPLAEIDYIVVNHTEPDHSGSLARLLREAPNATVLASSTAITFLKEIINEPFAHQAVTEKDSLDIGGMTLSFISVPMLHWPDSMFTYIPEIEALFTCDSFGCHFAGEPIFNDLMPKEMDFLPAYKYYFDNIIGPYANPHLVRALQKIHNLPISFIGNGHGPVLRSNIQYYLDLYRDWCQVPAKADKDVVIAYVSAYGYTKSLALAIEEGLHEGGISSVRLFDLVIDDLDQAQRAIAASTGFLLGSPTLLGDALPPLYAATLAINPIIHKGKPAGAFGSYAWSGEGVPNLMSRLEALRMTLPLPGLKVRLKPTEKDLAAAKEFGRTFGAELRMEN